MNKDLIIKYEKDSNFQTEVDSNLQRYRSLEQAAAYSDLSIMPDGILKKIQGRNIFFYFGYQQPVHRKDLHKVAMFLIKNFHPAENQPFVFVFFNELCPDNYALWNFRETFGGLKLEQIACMKELLVVKPYFYHKAMDWMTFGTIPKFLKSKTVFVHSYQDMCSRLGLSQQVLIDYVPKVLYSKQLPDLYAQSLPVTSLRENISGQFRTEEQRLEMSDFIKSVRSMIMKPGKQVNKLSDYEISQIGVPIILKMLIFYFENYPEGLLLEGLFRKSVSIDEETETINQILSKNYDYLLEVKNPHIIANLIKRFFASLKIPIFPFEPFQILMDDKNVPNKVDHLKKVIKMLPDLNQTTLMFVISFMRDHVISHQEQNKMGVQNLAICFAPCWFRSEKPSMADIVYASKGVIYAKHLIADFQTVFGSEEARQDLYRKSYYTSKKMFEDNLDIGLEATLKDVQSPAQNSSNARYSRQVQSHDTGILEKQLFKHQKMPSSILEDDAPEQQSDSKAEQQFLQILKESPEKRDNPRYSRYSTKVEPQEGQENQNKKQNRMSYGNAKEQVNEGEYGEQDEEITHFNLGQDSKIYKYGQGEEDNR